MNLRISFAAALVAACATVASAQQPAAPPPPAFAAPNLSPAGVRSMAANCAMCHGTEGKPAAGSSVPGLAGRRAQAIVEAMAEFKQGKRQATIMHQVAKGYSDAEIAAIAAFYATQP
jgi:cytochrome c553